MLHLLSLGQSLPQAMAQNIPGQRSALTVVEWLQRCSPQQISISRTATKMRLSTRAEPVTDVGFPRGLNANDLKAI